jgi:aspartyl/asparaginyl-tRNA synthetase
MKRHVQETGIRKWFDDDLIELQNQPLKAIEEFFKYGCPPHGGFGLGIDRLTMLLLGISIKEAMFLFRGPNRLTP